MKTKIFTLASVVLLLLAIDANAFNNPPKRIRKIVNRANYSMSVAEMTKNLQFDFAKADVHPAYTDRLDQLAKMLIDKNCAVALRGHADAIGKYVPNWKLSEKRADKIRDYLVSKGVSVEKIVTTPFGSTIPIASNKTAEGRQKNRRVEIRLSETGEQNTQAQVKIKAK